MILSTTLACIYKIIMLPHLMLFYSFLNSYNACLPCVSIFFNENFPSCHINITCWPNVSEQGEKRNYGICDWNKNCNNPFICHY